jgi:hypothetical protein
MPRTAIAGLSPLPGQAEIPGTAPISDAEQVRRKAAQPLRPTKPQARCDHGLFSYEAAQIDLVDLARACLQKGS